MGDNGGIPNINANANMGSSYASYVFLFINFVLQFLVLAIGLDMLDMFCSYHLLVNMVSLISMFLAIFYLLFLWIKYHGKLLIFLRIKIPYSRQFTPIGFAASMKPPAFEGTHFKKWRVRAILWFQTMNCYDATKGKPEGDLSAS
jgi:hypothetical protein